MDREEVWEDECSSHLTEDIDDLVSVETEPDELDNSFTIDADNSKAMTIVLWVAHFLLALQRRHLLPDAVLSLLLTFFSVLFRVLGRASSSDTIVQIVAAFPPSLYHLHKLVGYQKDSFIKYVTCPNPACSAIYMYKDCVHTVGTQKTSKRCSNSPCGRRKKCCSTLLRTVELASGKKVLYPYRIFCYQSILHSLQELLKQSSFVSDCEEWRKQPHVFGEYKDVFDGQIWREFQIYKGKPFLSSKHTFALMINIDWFQPFKHTQYSIGVVYLVVLNLPRHLRFRRENMILCGLIPGPHEPKGNINQFWKPLVDDLLKLWHGVTMTVYGSVKDCIVYAALLCVACDLPAGRKACGFLGHSATLGCSRCKKHFPGPVGNKDYSGFNRESWTPRNVNQHREDVKQVRDCKNMTEATKKESELGVRYSELLRLPYFDPVRMLIIDPMHCLYLGVAKHFFKNVWIEKEVLSTQQLKLLQKHVDSCITPPGIGRIPYKIATAFSGFTADQFKNWTNLFSLIALAEQMPLEHLGCWRTFVMASRILSKDVLTKDDIATGDALLLQFFKRIETLYGKMCITPNMHIACHLKDCMLDYGPLHSFWLFSFERLNGILENQPNNNRAVEIQLMRRFIRDRLCLSLLLPLDFSDDFSPILRQLQVLPPGSLGETLNPPQTAIVDVDLPKKYTRDILNDAEQVLLSQLYCRLYHTDNIRLNATYKSYTSVVINQKRFKATYHLANSLFYLARWDESLFGKFPDSNDTCLIQTATHDPFLRPVIIHYIAVHSFTSATTATSEKTYNRTVVSVSWPRRNRRFFLYGKPVQCFYYSDFLCSSVHSFIPVEYLAEQCVHSHRNTREGKLLLLLPLH